MDKVVVNRSLCSNRKHEMMCLAAMHIELENTILSKVNQRVKYKCIIFFLFLEYQDKEMVDIK